MKNMTSTYQTALWHKGGIASCLLAIALPASAALTSLDPLANAGFEAPARTDGQEADADITGWTRDNGGGFGETRHKNVVGETNWSTHDGGSNEQVAMMYVSGSDGSAWLYQGLQGTSDSNGSSHALTVGEIRGAQINITMWLGIENFAGWQKEDGFARIGFQSQGDWPWIGDFTVYTGSAAEAAAEGITADYYLDLDSAASGGDWAQLSHTVTISDTLGTNGNNATLSFNLLNDGYDSGETIRLLVDDVSLTQVPEPSSALLSALGLCAFVLRRRR